MATELISVYGNNSAIEEIRKKWNNLKLAAKSKVDASFWGARNTRVGSNSSGIFDDEDMFILAADKNITNSDRVRDMLETTPTFIESRMQLIISHNQQQKAVSQHLREIPLSLRQCWVPMSVKSRPPIKNVRKVRFEDVFQLIINVEQRTSSRWE